MSYKMREKNISDADPDLHASALYETFWIRIRLKNADPDSGGKKPVENALNKCQKHKVDYKKCIFKFKIYLYHQIK